MLSQEAVVAVEAAQLVVVLGVDQRGAALAAHEALEVPVALAVEHEVLDVDGQLAPAADLRGGLGPALLLRHARRHAPTRVHNTYLEK